MAYYFAINGYKIGDTTESVPIPFPKRGVKPLVTTVVNSGRNANGVVVGQKIGRDQYKLDQLEWAWLTAEQWSKLLSLLKDFFVTVTFWDPVTNGRKSLRMYCGDRSAEPYWVNSAGKPTHYKDCKVNLIDTGA